MTAAVKRRRALELRKSGLSYQRIADSPTDRGNGDDRPLYGSKASAYNAVQKALEELEAQTGETAHEVLALELARLDEMHAGSWLGAIRGNEKAVTSVLAIMARRTKYLGLDFADGLDERYLQVQEAEAARTRDAFEHSLRDVGMTDDEVREVMGRVAARLEPDGGTDPVGSAPA